MAQRVESTGTGGDKSTNSSYSRVMLISLLCLKELEKENKRKEKKIKHVVGGETTKNDVKKKRSGLENKIEKKIMLTKM